MAQNSGKANIQGALRMLAGFLVVGLGVFLTVRYFDEFFAVIKGCFGPFLIFVGLIMIAVSKE